MTINDLPLTPRTCTTGRRFGRLLVTEKAAGQVGAGSEIPKDAIPLSNSILYHKVSSVALLCQK